MKYFEDRPCEKACMLLMQAAREGIGWMEKGKYKRADERISAKKRTPYRRPFCMGKGLLT